MSAAVVEGNGAVTGHIISTTIGGKNGEPKRVCTLYTSVSLVEDSMFFNVIFLCNLFCLTSHFRKY